MMTSGLHSMLRWSIRRIEQPLRSLLRSRFDYCLCIGVAGGVGSAMRFGPASWLRCRSFLFVGEPDEGIAVACSIFS